MTPPPAAAALLAAAVLAAATGCSRPPAPLSPDALVDALVRDVPGWTAGTIGTVPPTGDGGLGGLLTAGDVPAACRDALAPFAEVGSPTAYAGLSFSRPGAAATDARQLDVGVSGYDQDTPALPDPGAAVRACPGFDLGEAGTRVHVQLRAESYDIPDTAGLGLDLTSPQEQIAFDLVQLRRGAQTARFSVTGPSGADNRGVLTAVVTAQADRLPS